MDLDLRLNQNLTSTDLTREMGKVLLQGQKGLCRKAYKIVKVGKNFQLKERYGLLTSISNWAINFLSCGPHTWYTRYSTYSLMKQYHKFTSIEHLNDVVKTFSWSTIDKVKNCIDRFLAVVAAEGATRDDRARFDAKKIEVKRSFDAKIQEFLDSLPEGVDKNMFRNDCERHWCTCCEYDEKLTRNENIWRIESQCLWLGRMKAHYRNYLSTNRQDHMVAQCHLIPQDGRSCGYIAIMQLFVHDKKYDYFLERDLPKKLEELDLHFQARVDMQTFLRTMVHRLRQKNVSYCYRSALPTRLRERFVALHDANYQDILNNNSATKNIKEGARKHYKDQRHRLLHEDSVEGGRDKLCEWLGVDIPLGTDVVKWHNPNDHYYVEVLVNDNPPKWRKINWWVGSETDEPSSSD